MDNEQRQYLQREDNFRQQDVNIAQNKLMLEQEAMGLANDDSNVSITKEQLDLTDEIRKIQNLLRGRVEVVGEGGVITWEEPESNDEILLTEKGINLVLSTVQWYLNKNTLLSNYDDKQIMAKMEDFSISLTDLLFMRYEKYFLYPTMEECEEELIKRIDNKVKREIYNLQLRGEEGDEKKLREKFIDEIDLDREKAQIREQGIKDKLKGFELLIRQIQDVVHSTYQRAWKGQERTTIRQRINISENRTPMQPYPQARTSAFSFFKKK